MMGSKVFKTFTAFVSILLITGQVSAIGAPLGAIKQVTEAAKIIATATEATPEYLQAGESLLEALRAEFERSGSKKPESYSDLNLIQVPVFTTLIKYAKSADVDSLLNIKMFLLENVDYIFGAEVDDLQRAMDSLKGVISKDTSVKEKLDIAMKWAGTKSDGAAEGREAAITVIESL